MVVILPEEFASPLLLVVNMDCPGSALEQVGALKTLRNELKGEDRKGPLVLNDESENVFHVRKSSKERLFFKLPWMWFLRDTLNASLFNKLKELPALHAMEAIKWLQKSNESDYGHIKMDFELLQWRNKYIFLIQYLTWDKGDLKQHVIENKKQRLLQYAPHSTLHPPIKNWAPFCELIPPHIR